MELFSVSVSVAALSRVFPAQGVFGTKLCAAKSNSCALPLKHTHTLLSCLVSHAGFSPHTSCSVQYLATFTFLIRNRGRIKHTHTHLAKVIIRLIKGQLSRSPLKNPVRLLQVSLRLLADLAACLLNIIKSSQKISPLASVSSLPELARTLAHVS